MTEMSSAAILSNHIFVGKMRESNSNFLDIVNQMAKL